MRNWLRRGAEIFPFVAFLCFNFSVVQTDISTTVSAGTTSSHFIGSSKKAASLSLQGNNVTMTTIATPIEPARARITKVEPQYGPVSGGTRVIVSGQDMTCPRDHRINVHLIFGSTQLTAHNCTKESDVVICFTPPKGTPESAEFKVQVSCDEINNNDVILWMTNDSVIFIYKRDPIITDVFPKESILAGGITQSVVGRNLDAVAHPQMWTGYDLPSTGQGQPCIVQNSTLLLCRTQPIDLGSSSSNESVRSHPEEINLNQRKVWIGFMFDGVTAFQRFADLRMFHNPEIDKFKPETKVHVANEKNVLSIGVTWPHMNFTADDLTVHVGIRTCTDVQLDKNSLICHPPPLSKSIIRYGPSELNTLAVTVSVGDLTRDVGHLHYTSTESFHVIMSVMIAILAFIFVVSCSCGCCVFFDLRVKECKGRSKKTQFRAVSDACESTLDGNEKDGSSGVREGGKRRGKRSEANPAEREGSIECVVMQYRGDGRDPQ